MGFDEGPPLERVTRNDNRRWPVLVIGLGVVLVALGAVHPWSDGPLAVGQGDQPAGGLVAGSSAAVTPQTFDPNRLFPQCYPTLGWRVASMQQLSLYKVRTAWPVSTAPRPTATAANTPTLYGAGVEAIGFCTPGTDPLTRAQYVGDVTLWRRSVDGQLSRTDGTVIDTSLAEHGEVYLAPPASLEINGSWPVGDYFFQVRPRGTAIDVDVRGAKWLPLRIVANPARNAS